MDKVRVYQIGLGSFGWNGFEKLVELTQEFEKIELAGICEKDFDLIDRAKRYAENSDIEIDIYKRTEKMYTEARESKEPGTQVMVYDAGPATSHAEHIYQSMNNNFFHLAEKPPSMTRGQHMKEKRLASEGKAMWTVDFIERESPVVKKALELIEGDIQSIEVFRESSIGVKKTINERRPGVVGGDILDKMTHEVYVLDILEHTDPKNEIKLEEVECKHFQPRKTEGQYLTDIYGGRTDSINMETSTAMTQAELSYGDTTVKLNSSWIGLSREAMIKSQQLEKATGRKFFERKFSTVDGKAFTNEECRFFILKGDRELAGDMLRKELYDLETGKQIELDSYLHDQLYRVIEKAVFHAGGKDVEIVPEEEINSFMNTVFDIKESVNFDRDYFEEIEKTQQKINKMISEDRKIYEPEKSDAIAG